VALVASLARVMTQHTHGRATVAESPTTTDMDIDDRIEASDAACDAAMELERLQQTETWLLLNSEVKREVCQAHALLNGLARLLAPAKVPA
jgi:hypothetical protein